MTELETDVARAVAALRSARNPPATAKARVHARLEAALLGGGGLEDDGGALGDGLGDGGLDLDLDPSAARVTELGVGARAGSGVGAGAAKLAFAAKVVGATASLTAAGLLALKLGALGYRALAPGPAPELEAAPGLELAVTEPEPNASVPAASEPAKAELTPPAVGAAEGASEPAGSAAPAAPTSEPARERSRPEPTATATATAAAATTAADTLAAELALIDAARRASEPAAAIAQLRAHAERFPSGSLRDERDALWAIASCERGELDDARRRAEALEQRRPSSPLLERIATACPDALR